MSTPLPAFLQRGDDISSKKKLFDQKVNAHKSKMSTNPFSENYKGSNIPGRTKDDPNYGRPVAGSKTEKRALRASAHINAEVSVLCDIIYQEGEKYEDGTAAIRFGDLFQIYTRISNKVVGILMRARRHHLLDFEGEMLFQRRDDDVPIVLLKPIQQIKEELADDTEFEIGSCHKEKQS